MALSRRPARTETGANLYRTTTYFLERIGVTSLDELPELAPYLPDMEDLEDEMERVGSASTPAETSGPTAEEVSTVEAAPTVEEGPTGDTVEG